MGHNGAVYIVRYGEKDTGDPEVKKLQKEYDLFIGGFSTLPLYLLGTTYWKALQVVS